MKFLFGPDGKIKKVWPVEHTQEVLAALYPRFCRTPFDSRANLIYLFNRVN